MILGTCGQFMPWGTVGTHRPNKAQKKKKTSKLPSKKLFRQKLTKGSFWGNFKWSSCRKSWQWLLWVKLITYWKDIKWPCPPFLGLPVPDLEGLYCFLLPSIDSGGSYVHHRFNIWAFYTHFLSYLRSYWNLGCKCKEQLAPSVGPWIGNWKQWADSCCPWLCLTLCLDFCKLMWIFAKSGNFLRTNLCLVGRSVLGSLHPSGFYWRQEFFEQPFVH